MDIQRDRQQLDDLEISILDLIAKGYRYEDIAKKLYLSKYTVRNYVNKIYIKLNAQNSPNAVYLSIVKGVIQINDI